jgi:hypothetical protein
MSLTPVFETNLRVRYSRLIVFFESLNFETRSFAWSLLQPSCCFSSSCVSSFWHHDSCTFDSMRLFFQCLFHLINSVCSPDSAPHLYHFRSSSVASYACFHFYPFVITSDWVPWEWYYCTSLDYFCNKLCFPLNEYKYML